MVNKKKRGGAELSYNISDNSENNSKLYENIASASYDMSGLALKGGRQGRQGRQGGQGLQKRIDGGCFTCGKGVKKIDDVFKTLTDMIPKYFRQYKSTCQKRVANKTSSASKPTRKTKGGYSWFGSDCNQTKADTLGQNFSLDVMNTNDLNFTSRNDMSIYSVDQTFTDNTSALGRL